jgi:hypothetical protein
MKIEKKIIKESIGDKKMSPETFSTQKQNIILTESQLDTLLKKIRK